MRLIDKVSRYIISSIILFTLASSLISLSVWLDMRIHARHIVYVCFAIMLLFIILKDFKNPKPLLIGDLAMIIIFFLGKFNRVAYELREAFKIGLKIYDFKIVLIVVIIITSFITFYNYYKNLRNIENS